MIVEGNFLVDIIRSPTQNPVERVINRGHFEHEFTSNLVDEYANEREREISGIRATEVSEET